MPPAQKFSRILSSRKFIVTAEFWPPRGSDLAVVRRGARIYKGKVAAVNVVDNPGSNVRVSSLVGCHLLRQEGLEVILQVACRDRNRLAIESDLLSAAALGIRNLLVVTGDYPTLGDYSQAKPVFDLDSIQVLHLAQGLNRGQDSIGRPLEGRVEFCLGAVVNPSLAPLELQVLRMRKKIAAGAAFFQTQPVWEVRELEDFRKLTGGLGAPVLAGVIPLRSARMARFMNANIPGIKVPESVIETMEQASDPRRRGLEIAAQLVRDLRSLCEGVHIMPIGADESVPRVLDLARI
jgi:5,10-methylenetetrahydrofolate reductase